MTTRTGLFLAMSALLSSAAQAANVRTGTPQLLDTDQSASCVVPASFSSGGTMQRALFVGTGIGIVLKREGQPTRLLWSRSSLKGGEQKAAGVFMATSFGLIYSPDGFQVRYLTSARYSLVTPYGWVKDGDGLWNLSDQGIFSRSGLPVAPWFNVTGIAPSTNYLYGPNLLWVGTAGSFNYYQRGIYQAVVVNGISYPTYGLPDFQRVTGICGVTGGHLMVYNGMILHHQDVTDPYALLYTDLGLPTDNYTLQSLRYGPNDVDAVAYVGRTLWLNLTGGTPTPLVMPGTVRYVTIDPSRRELIVCTSAGIFTVPYSLV
jgi:hypothetical protein